MIGDETTSGSKPPVPAPTTIRLVNFISEDQVDEAKWTRGQRAGDDTTQSQSEKPLFQYHLCPFCDGCWDHKELPPQSPLTTLSTSNPPLHYPHLHTPLLQAGYYGWLDEFIGRGYPYEGLI
uniref:Uncharacterized protein n=1 Tax=Oryza meridionalis TaxID=40149 RepID=A0A0E0DY53_9ORYZ